MTAPRMAGCARDTRGRHRLRHQLHPASRRGRPPSAGRLIDVDRRMEVVRLGQGVDRTGRIAPEAMERTLEAARRYAQVCADLGAGRIRFVATSATRDAQNRQEFVDGVRAALGVQPEVIGGEEEARLSFRGATSVLAGRHPGPFLVVDICLLYT